LSQRSILLAQLVAAGPRASSLRHPQSDPFSSLLYPSFRPVQLQVALHFARSQCSTALSSTSPPVTTANEEPRCLPRSRWSRRRSSWGAPATT
jgi:hypothetical protein